jgi:hypothetical protein
MTAPMIDPQQQQGPPQPPVPPTPPWTPFAPMPTDEDPLLADMRRRKLAKLIDSAKFEGMPPEWQQVAIAEYQKMAQVVAAAQPPAPLPKGVNIQDKVTGGNIGAEEQAAAHPAAPQQQQPQRPPQ